MNCNRLCDVRVSKLNSRNRERGTFYSFSCLFEIQRNTTHTNSSSHDHPTAAIIKRDVFLNIFEHYFSLSRTAADLQKFEEFAGECKFEMLGIRSKEAAPVWIASLEIYFWTDHLHHSKAFY